MKYYILNDLTLKWSFTFPIRICLVDYAPYTLLHKLNLIVRKHNHGY